MVRTTITTTTKKRAAKPRVRKPATVVSKAATGADVAKMIAEAAYYKAQARGFAPGHDESDWLSAERDILESLNSG